MFKGLFLLSEHAYNEVYSPLQRKKISTLVDIYVPAQTSESILSNPEVLKYADMIFSGWGAPRMDEEFLSNAPNLKVVFYGAGTIKYFITDAVWNRDIRVTSAYMANAVPVAEYVLSQIIFCLKLGWQYTLYIRRNKTWPSVHQDGSFTNFFGAFGSTVGIISLGAISRKLVELLQNFDINVLAYSNHLTEEQAFELGVKKCELDDIFRLSDVVSLHSPANSKNRGLITGKHFSMMKENASFINSARGEVVREEEMIDVLSTRKDLIAVLDVTNPEPPMPDSRLYTTPNIVLTPHIAGSLGKECQRMGQYMVEELKRYLAGKPLKWEIMPRETAYLA